MRRFNPYQIQQILERTEWKPNLVPASDRAWWEAACSRADGALVAELLAEADRALGEPPVFMPASVYLKFRETGDRTQYEALIHSRGRAVSALALAECLTGEGQYLTALQDYIWAICEQSTWSLPAHLPNLPDPQDPYIDLGVAMTGLALSDIFVLLSERFDPGVRQRLRGELDTRLWSAYLAHNDFHWQGNWLERSVGNWTAVCTAGVLGSAVNMNLEPEKLSRVVDRGLRSLEEYLETFDPDGGSSEGPGYWDYGFGYFSIIAQLLAQRTDGWIDMFDNPQVHEIAQFPLRTRLSPGHYVSFSDCSLDVQMEPALLELLAQRLDLPELRSLVTDGDHPRAGVRGLTWLIRDLNWRQPNPAQPTELPDHVWFSGLHWMISRDRQSGLVLAIKGGNNHELHNQNDVGSVIVHIDGESLVADPGRGVYTRQYFGPERYTYLVNNSRGHSVPVVAGFDQPAGAEFSATVVSHDHTAERDTLRLDMTRAYPKEAGHASLQRTAVLHRADHVVTLTDAFAFAAGPASFESVLISLAAIETGSDHVTIRGDRHALRIGFDPRIVRFALDMVPQVDLASGPADVHRLVFSPVEPVQQGEIRLTIGIAQ
jgi:hypothetical protein